MGNQWIIDVIVDLKSFAQQNELPVLAKELARLAAVADAEIDPDKKGASSVVRSEQTESRRILTQA
jgi:hypothetical protein